jgi:hypothetical protein
LAAENDTFRVVWLDLELIEERWFHNGEIFLQDRSVAHRSEGLKRRASGVNS